MKRILLAGAALAALSSASYAADMPVYEPVPVVATVDTWDGFYVGLTAGYAWGDLDVDSTPLGVPTTVSSDLEGAFGGAYWGRNWQSGNWVFGLDGSIQVTEIDNGTAAAVGDPDIEIDFFSASRLRVGYAFDNFMLYAAGGFSLAKANVDDGSDDDDTYLKGFTVGAGGEMKLTENWSARVEYLYINYGEEQRTLFDGSGETYEIEVDDVHAVRAGVAYHF